jgi:hypothetical protein
MATSPVLNPSERAELEFRLRLARMHVISTVLTTGIKYGALVACVGLTYLSIAALAGKTTLASFGLEVLGNIKLSQGICTILTGGSILYGVGQRQLRHRAVKRLANTKNELERIIDKGRASSGLTDTGTTRPEDKS